MPPAPRPSSDSYSASGRVHRLIEWLRSGERLTTTLAAEALAVSRRTVARDLAYLRDVLGLRVEYDPAKRSYVLADGHAALPFLPHASIIPALVRALPPGVRSDDNAEYPTVHLRFSARAVGIYTDRGGTLRSGTLNPDGTLDLYLSTPNIHELVNWVLSCGSEVEIVEPRTLRGRVRMEIQRMMEIYGAGETSAT
ncbi:MAG: WYL domain-containing protein [Bacteroidota bacterium]